MNTMFAHLPDHQRRAGLEKAEKAIRDLTDAADLLGIADRLSAKLVSLWDAFHGGQAPPLAYETQGYHRGNFGHDRRILASTEGQRTLRDVIERRLSAANAARLLNVHPNRVYEAVQLLRREQQQPTPETALT